MKKILSIIFSVILLVSCFSLTAFANEKLFNFGGEDAEIDFDKIDKTVEGSISEDFQTLYINGESFSAFNANFLEVDFYIIDIYEGENDFSLSRQLKLNYTDKQKETIESISVECDSSENIFYVEIVQNNGSVFKGSFLRDTKFSQYEEYLNGEGVFTIDFEYPRENKLEISKEDIYGETFTLKGSRIDFLTGFAVSFTSNDGVFVTDGRGAVFVGENEYYFVDCAENNGAEASLYGGLIYEYDSKFTAHKITNPRLIEQINQCVKTHDEYYALEYEDPDYEILYDEEKSYAVAIELLVLYFGVVPVAIFILYLIRAIKAKKIYRIMYLTTAVLSILTVVISAILALWLC